MKVRFRNESRVSTVFNMRSTLGTASAILLTLVSATAGAQEEDGASEPTGDDAAAKASVGGSLSLGGGAEAEADAGADGETSGEAEASGDESAPAAATEPVSTEVPAYAGVRADTDRYSDKARYAKIPYMQRYKPQAGLWEIGMYGGMLFPSSSHNLKVAVLGHEPFKSVAGIMGGRFAYFATPYLAGEIEGYGGGGAADISEYSAIFYTVRGHVLAQLPMWSVAPFVLIGAGVMGAATETMGHDRDPQFHWGAGVKVPFNHRITGRFDFRDSMTQKHNAKNGSLTHHPELHLGLSFVFEREAPPMPVDRDYDGLYDDEDKCPDVGALTVDGCRTLSDSDGDGISDDEDQCPMEEGPAPTGCPEKDADGDGVVLPADQCPDEPGPSPSGCPDKDIDGDGLVGEADKCPKKPENRNGFQDSDGCPDEMPEAIKRFTGVIQGINFKQGTAEIEESSHPTLDSAVEILKKHESIRIEVSGHTSSEGSAERNQELSDERAAAVRDYFVKAGVTESRVVARGAGPSEPVADNETKEGRQQNRRIEFRILSQP